MYNLNVNLAETAANAANTLLMEANGPTPRTPEILNSLIDAMTNPMDSYFEHAKIRNGPLTNLSTDSNSSCSSQIESPTRNPPSVQHTCSQLIKAGLKLSIEQKRKHQNDGEDILDLDKCKRMRKTECSESEEDKHRLDNGIMQDFDFENDDFCYSNLTPEDEERRRRRRERNKIAATKCRLKKRERTANLVNESEFLENQNYDFKSQLQELQKQKRMLEETLSNHRPICQNNIKQATRDNLYKLPPVSSVLDNHTYSRPASLDPSYNRQTIEYCNRPASAPYTNMRNNNSLNHQYAKNPSIIVEEIGDDCQTQFTNLENAQTDYYNHHTYTNYNSNAGLDNGCMA